MSSVPVSTGGKLETLSKDRMELLKLLREEGSRKSSRIRPAPRPATSGVVRMPASWQQQRLWFIDKLEEGRAGYQVPVAVRLRGALDVEALRQALDALVQRHEILRAVFVNDEGDPVQQIAPHGRFALRVIDISSTPEPAREEEIRRHKLEEVQGKFDLGTGPLIRARLLRVQPEEHALLITMHHIIADGWSKGVLIREVTELYESARNHRDATLPPLQIQYADFAYWQRQQWLEGVALREQLNYWRERLRGAVPHLELPTDRPRPIIQSYHGANVRITLDAQLCAKLRALAQQHQMTLFMILYAGWAMLLSRLSGQDDVLVGSPIANRQRPEVEGLIGLFVNTLVLRAHVHGGMRLDEFLSHVKEVILGAYDHQGVPFEKIVEALQPERHLNRNPVFQTVFVLHNEPKSEMRLPGLDVALEEEVDEPSILDLWLSLEERGSEIVGSVNYAMDLFDHETVERWMACFATLLRSMAHGAAKRVGDLPMLPEAERRRLESFNPAPIPRVAERIHEIIEAQVQRTPDAVAVAFEDQALTYEELNRKANQLARYLRACGVGPDRLVGICAERSLEMVVGLLGILKSGGAYVPLDPNYPPERLQYMMKNSDPPVVLTQSHLKSTLPPTDARVIALDADWDEIAQHSDVNLDFAELGLTPRHLAYVIYTSGSTGMPKGAMNEHRAVVNRLRWMQEAYQLNASDRVLQKTPFSFDVSVWEFFWPLMTGARLVVARPLGHQDPQYLKDLIRQAGITTLHFVPSMLQIFLQQPLGEDCASLRHIVCSGEELPATVARKCLESLPQAGLYNLYGPTEAAVDVTEYDCRTDAKAERIPIGRPIANTRIHILDAHGEPVPVGVAGELHIGGIAVGRGYLNRPELTTERFIADRFSKDPQARLYKTGDLARWRADGAVEYLGRNDHQVKIRGFRIELGEIEARLRSHAEVHEAAVLAREDVPGEKRLAAYVSAGSPSAEILRAYLRDALPEYMVPAAFVYLDNMPLSPNGKLDRKALPAPDTSAFTRREYEAPQGEAEEALATIWQELLHVERVGRRDNFFELGGHSLMIVQIMDRLRCVGLGADVRSAFEKPMLSDFAATLTREIDERLEVAPNLIPRGSAVITPDMLPLVQLDQQHIDHIVQSVAGGARNVQDVYPLAPLQEGILFHHLLSEASGDSYIMPILLSIRSRSRLDDLISALQAVINRHDVLRTAILWEKLPQPVQVVYREAQLPVEEVVLDPHVDALEQVHAWTRPERQRMSLQRAPLVRLKTAENLRTGECYALLQIHHIIDDATSLRIVVSEAVAHLEGRAHELPEPMPYRNHVAQALAYAGQHDAEAFFRGKLAHIAEPTAPFGLLDVHGDGSQTDDAEDSLDRELSQRIRTQARRFGVGAATLFHVAWGLVLARTSGRNEVVFGSVLLGRLQGTAGAQRVLGMFINTLPLSLQLFGASARECVEQTQRELIDLLNHEQASLATAQRCSGISGSAPLFTTLFNYRHQASSEHARWSSASGIQALSVQERTNYPITVSVDDLGESFGLSAQTDRRIGSPRVIGYLATAVRSLVDALEREPHTPVLALPVLPAEELHQILQRFNATQADYPRQRLVHELFEAQAGRMPNAVAAIHHEESITYARLNAQANQLARVLMEEGVVADALVGICVERSVEMVVGLLGILKAGAAYVPLDPNYPPERLQYMLQDSAPRVVLTQEKLKGALPPTDAKLIALDTRLQELAAYSCDNLAAGELGLTPRNLVYAIYTSGSTGRPKGIGMPHQAMVNLIEWHRRTFDTERGPRALQFAALSFDVAFQEIFSTLCTGGTLVLLDEWMRRDPPALTALIHHQAIERLFVPPLMLQSLAEHAAATGTSPPPTLKDVIVAGEQLRISPEISRFFAESNGCRLHNHYGPSETHVVTALTLSGHPAEWPALPSIGQPIANTQIYVLDEQLEVVPVDVPGEIYIGGTCVAREYLHQPDLTAKRFVSDPFSRAPDARLYKTGDVGCWRSDGTLEYLGRNDDQVKIRGYRVELGEIEAQLARHAGVKEAAVIARQDASGSKRLVAYVTEREPGTLASEDLRAQVRAALPEYMVPGVVMMLESMPLTPSGKLNRRALPAPDPLASGTGEQESPVGEIEEGIAAIWGELLELKRVGRQENFFELGGHSLLGMKVITRLAERYGVRLSSAAVFEYPTVELMARMVESASVAGTGAAGRVELDEGVI